MRVTDTAVAAGLVDQIGDQESAITGLEGQLGSGLAITQPSDNPDGTVAALAMQSQLSQATSWQGGLTTASTWLGLANSTATSVVAGLQQARTLMLQAMNTGVQSSTTYQGLAQQLTAVRSDLLGLANTQLAGQPIFAGTSAGSAAYDASGTYQGTGTAPSVVVGPGASPGRTLDLSVTGPQLFGSGASSTFSVLAKAAADITAPGGPSSAALQSDLAGIDASLTQATGAAATLGDLSAEQSSVSSALASQVTGLQEQLGTLVSVNVPQVTTQLNTDMTNYQAALWAAAKAIPPSLVEYL